MRRFLVACGLVACGCGGTPTSPTSLPAIGEQSPAAAFRGLVTETLTGAPVIGFTALVSGGRVTVTAPGYVTRETRADAPIVDLIREAGFNLAFYRQLTRGALTGNLRPLRLLSRNVSIYLQTRGLDAATVTALERTARSIVPAMTGGRLTVAAWDTGEEARARAVGWLTVALINSLSGPCGQTDIGASVGAMDINTAPQCLVGGRVHTGLFAHELGHALGFDHVSGAEHMMNVTGLWAVTGPSALERHHAALAYARPSGNRDVDRD